MGKIASEWDKYRREVMPPDAPPTQIRECRLAFYAGAAALFGAVIGVLGPEDEPTEEEMSAVSALHDELTTHARQVLAGRN